MRYRKIKQLNDGDIKNIIISKVKNNRRYRFIITLVII